jgi:hypothetical protein
MQTDYPIFLPILTNILDLVSPSWFSLQWQAVVNTVMYLRASLMAGNVTSNIEINHKNENIFFSAFHEHTHISEGKYYSGCIVFRIKILCCILNVINLFKIND